jgi:hypothetical protein
VAIRTAVNDRLAPPLEADYEVGHRVNFLLAIHCCSVFVIGAPVFLALFFDRRFRGFAMT